MNHVVYWHDFEDVEPKLAGVCRESFLRHPHHVLATIRSSGAPRVGGTNVFFNDGHLWFGATRTSGRVRDLRSRPDCALHSAPLDKDLVIPDIQIDGLAKEAPSNLADKWLSDHEGDDGVAFVMDIRCVTVLSVESSALRIETWSPRDGYNVKFLK